MPLARKKNRSPVPIDYQELYRRTPTMMHSIDAEGRLVNVSDFWLETLGYERDEVLGRKLTDFFTDKSKDLAEDTVLPHFFDIGTVREIPYQMVTKHGDILDVLISATSERDDQGLLLYSMAAIFDVTERKKAEEQVQRLAHYDILTGLPNRLLLQERLQHALIQAQRDEHSVGVLFVDLDHFKWVNDTLGHDCGDEMLKNAAHSLQSCVRRGDTVARLSGDEFVVILYGYDSEEELPRFAQRFLGALRHSVRLKGVEVYGSASIGIAIYPADGMDASTLLRNADTAMYAAKDLGRNTYQFYSSEMNLRTLNKRSLEDRLRRALKHDEFHLEYQPQVALKTGRVTGFEALVRWHDPEMGLIPPAEFLPAAEACGLIYPIGEWVLENACRQARVWQDQGFPPVRMAVNVSGQQFGRHDFIDMIEEKLELSGLDPQYLEIELTESVVMENLQRGMERLADLKVRNINLAIDDFGTGYSSLVYLKHFPFDRIKIAQEFLRDIPGDEETMAIVEAIFALAASLQLDVIAEGVERREQLEYLIANRCQEMQGFYFSKPCPADALTDAMSKNWVTHAHSLFHA